MPSGSYRQTDVRCPFYRYDTEGNGRGYITCEGIIPGSASCRSFLPKADYHRQMKVFCCLHYDRCEIYRAVMAAKYDDA